MKMKSWVFIPLIIFMGLVIFLGKGLTSNPRKLPSVQIGKSIPDFKLPSLDTQGEDITPARFENQVFLLNFFASWCMSCGEEQAFLVELAATDVPIYGVNYKDTESQAKEWLNTYGNPYRFIAQDKNGRLAFDLGVYGTPETFLVDKRGIIRYRHVGVLTKTIWLKELATLKHQLEQE